MQKDQWKKITSQLHIMLRSNGRIELSDVAFPDQIEDLSVEIFQSEVKPLIEALQSLLPEHEKHQDTPCALYADPQQDHILIALVIDGKVHSISRVDHFDAVHHFIYTCQKEGYIIDEVRIDTGFRTAESREQARRFNWIVDRSFDVRKMKVGEMIGAPEPVRAAGYRPTHGGFPESHTGHEHGIEATNDFLRVGPSGEQRGENLFE